MPRRELLTGNEAVAQAVALANAQVIGIYPITPQTTIIEKICDLAAKGAFHPRIIHVESEHSAMAAVIGAAFTGARTFTATSSQGLALMHELLHWAGGGRLPIVLANVNRAMAPGWSIWTDQNDSLSQRDTGWMQFYCESAQEVLDTTLLAFRVSERVMVPSMVVLDAFVLSHTSEPTEVPDADTVAQFLPKYEAPYRLDVEKPCSFGALLRPPFYQEVRAKLQEAMEGALKEIDEADQLWRKLTGRGWGIVSGYRHEDADILFVTSATTASTARVVIDRLRVEGIKIGGLKVRVFRPFPFEELRRALAGRRLAIIFDRNLSYGHHGIFAQEIKSALYGWRGAPPVSCYVGGLGGRDVTPESIEGMVRRSLGERNGELFSWVR
ncbi:MAG: pyruvate ferredoxin oxidoreductase [Planctomycetes bacterium]|nr:pyruvate ferredoxin oxidoreductase [Planctomycetota bacterium]